MTFERIPAPAHPPATASPRTRPHNKDELGRIGEQIAADFLTAHGFEVIERNWRSRVGELDIVAREGATVVFVEVKTRSTDRFGLPVEAVGPVKLARLRSLAAEWLAAHDMRTPHVRIDVVSVLGVGPGALIDHRVAVG